MRGKTKKKKNNVNTSNENIVQFLNSSWRFVLSVITKILENYKFRTSNYITIGNVILKNENDRNAGLFRALHLVQVH